MAKSRRSVSNWVSPGTAQTDTALLPLQMGPAAHQAGGEVTQLGQFDLELALEGARPLGKDVEDQTGAVDHPTLKQTLQVALLGRGQGMIEDDQVGRGGRDQVLEFVGLARADEEPRVGAGAAPGQGADHLGTGRAGEQVELLTLVRLSRAAQVQLDQDCTLTGIRSLKHPLDRPPGWGIGPAAAWPRAAAAA